MSNCIVKDRILIESICGFTCEAHFGILEPRGGLYMSTPAFLIKDSTKNADAINLHLLEKPTIITDSIPIYCVITKNTKTGAVSRAEYGPAFASDNEVYVDVTNNDQVIRFMAQKIWGLAPEDIKGYRLVPVKE